MPTEPLDLVALRALCDAASDGPWVLPYEDGAISRTWDDRDQAQFPDDDGIDDISLCAVDEDGLGKIDRRADAAFITAAREALPVLIAEVERLRAEARAPCGACGHEWPNEEAP